MEIVKYLEGFRLLIKDVNEKIEKEQKANFLAYLQVH